MLPGPHIFLRGVNYVARKEETEEKLTFISFSLRLWWCVCRIPQGIVFSSVISFSRFSLLETRDFPHSDPGFSVRFPLAKFNFPYIALVIPEGYVVCTNLCSTSWKLVTCKETTNHLNTPRASPRLKSIASNKLITWCSTTVQFNSISTFPLVNAATITKKGEMFKSLYKFFLVFLLNP